MTMKYELYRWDREDLGGSIRVYAEINRVTIEDCTFGKTCEGFWGKDEHECTITLQTAAAEAILTHVGAPIDGRPTEVLGVWLAANMTGHSDVISSVKELAKSAGARIEEFAW